MFTYFNEEEFVHPLSVYV